MKPIAILHEGNVKPTHDNHLLGLLIRHLNLDIDLVDFYGMKSKGNFFKSDYVAYKTLKSRFENDQIKKILLIADADYIENDAKYGGYQNTQTALNAIVEQLGLKEISFAFVMCDPATNTGYLESFILSTIPDAQRNCIECFLNCSNFKSKENHKAILNQIYNIAYPDAPYDFEHKHFEPLKTALVNLFCVNHNS
ncbi:MAG TPA: hypothetical protein VIF37_21325 [Methylobacter sp.]|jgi:hypothetical protein